MTGQRKALRDLVAAVGPLVDPDGRVAAHSSAWEIDPHGPPDQLDGEQLHAALAEAYRTAVEALKPRPGEIPCTITMVTPPPPEIRIVPVYLPPGHGPMRA